MAEITLRTDLSELATLAGFVERFATEVALPGDVAVQLDLVLEELVTNAIMYGHPQGGTGTVQLRLTRGADAVEIDMIDDGVAFDPRTLPQPDLDAPLDERPIGGLGIHLVRQFVDEIDYRRDGGRNHLHLRRRLTPRRRAGAGNQRG